MSLTLEADEVRPRGLRAEWTRLGSLAALAVAELMLLTIRYDAQSLVGQGWLGRLALASKNLPQIALVGLVAFLVAKGSSRWTFDRAKSESTRGASMVLAWCLIHAGSFLAFFSLTGRVVEGTSESRSLLVALWWAAALLTGVSAALIARPFEDWRRLFVLLRPHAFAAALICCGAWGFARLTPLLWVPLGGATRALVSAMLGLCFTDVVAEPARLILGTSRFSVRIAPECSGYEGIGLILVFLASFLWLARGSLRFPRALWLLPLGVATIWSTNVVRIFGLIVLGTLVSPSVALGGFHSQAGWLAFNAVGLGLVYLARRSPWFLKTESTAPVVAESRPESTEYGADASAFGPTAAYLAPMMAVVLAGMIGSALSSGFDTLYPLRVLGVVAALILVRRHGRVWTWTWSWSAFGVGVGVFFVWMALEPTPAPSAALDDGLASLSPAGRWTWLFFRCFGSVITVPIAEELAFRGYVPRRLLSADFTAVPLGKFTAWTAVASSVLFGLMHGRALAGTVAGLAYAFALSRRGRLGDAILAHAVTNLLIAIYVMTTGQTSVWS